MKTKTLVGLGLAALAFVAPADAQAKPFATDSFSIELGDTPVCFAVPVSLRDPAACRGLPPLGAGDIDNTQIGLIAAGGIRRPVGEPAAPGSLPIIGLLQMFQVPASLTHHPDAAHAERVAVDATKAILANLPTEARRGRPIPRIETVDGLVVVRTAVDVDGLTPGTRAHFFAHIETATIFGTEATYTVVWSGPESTKAALVRLADEATKTMRLVPAQHPATKTADGNPVSIFAKTGMLFAAIALVLGVYLRSRRGKTHRLRAELWPVAPDSSSSL